MIDGHGQQGESDLRRGNRCAILAIRRDLLILALKGSVDIEVIMSDAWLQRHIPLISMDAGCNIRKVVRHQPDEIYVYRMDIGRCDRQGTVEKQHINATLELIANIFNDCRHHAGGAEAICRHITLKITPADHTVPRIVTDVVNANKWDRVFSTRSQDVFGHSKFEAQFVYRTD